MVAGGGVGKQSSRRGSRGKGKFGGKVPSGQRADRAGERLRRIEALLDQLEKKLQEGEFRPTVGDFIRLLELERELAQERPREIVVQWVEPSETDDVSAG